MKFVSKNGKRPVANAVSRALLLQDYPYGRIPEHSEGINPEITLPNQLEKGKVNAVGKRTDFAGCRAIYDETFYLHLLYKKTPFCQMGFLLFQSTLLVYISCIFTNLTLQQNRFHMILTAMYF